MTLTRKDLKVSLAHLCTQSMEGIRTGAQNWSSGRDIYHLRVGYLNSSGLAQRAEFEPKLILKFKLKCPGIPEE